MNTQDFYIETYSFIKTTTNDDISFIPSLLRRKLSSLNRSVFYTLNKTYDDKVDSIVYASRYGEFDKLIKLINQFKTENEVSPILFSSSVHNATIGAFLLYNQSPKPYTAISSVTDTLQNGILTAVINDKDCLLCYADYIDKEPISISVLFSKNEKTGKRCRLMKTNENDNQNNDYIENFIDFLSGKTNQVRFNNFKIEAIKDE